MHYTSILRLTSQTLLYWCMCNICVKYKCDISEQVQYTGYYSMLSEWTNVLGAHTDHEN